MVKPVYTPTNRLDIVDSATRDLIISGELADIDPLVTTAQDIVRNMHRLLKLMHEPHNVTLLFYDQARKDSPNIPRFRIVVLKGQDT